MVTVGEGQKVKVQSVSVPASLILLETLQESLVVVEDQVLEHASLRLVQESLLGHLAHHGEQHARLGPHLGR